MSIPLHIMVMETGGLREGLKVVDCISDVLLVAGSSCFAAYIVLAGVGIRNEGWDSI